MNLPRIEVLTRCPTCQSRKINLWTPASDLLMQSSSQEFEYSNCLNCETIFMSKRPQEEDVAFYYSENYHPYQANVRLGQANKTYFIRFLSIFKKIFIKFESILKKFLNKQPADTIQEKYYLSLPKAQSYLDFGCGAGKSLDSMKLLGYKNTIGVDFSPVAINAVSKRSHKAYLVNDFWTECKDQNIGLIRMNHVVEHLYHPHDVLKGIASKLVDGGVLHIAVPNPNGISAKIFKRNWHGLDCPRHVILYPPKTLIKLLTDSGFEDFLVIQEGITKDFVRSLGYWLASYGLFELKNVNNLMNNKWLALIFWPLVKIATIFGKGDRYHIVCHKKLSK